MLIISATDSPANIHNNAFEANLLTALNTNNCSKSYRHWISWVVKNLQILRNAEFQYHKHQLIIIASLNEFKNINAE